MNDVITNTFIVQNPEIDNVRNVLKDYIKNHHYRFIQSTIICRWELCFSDSSSLSPISSITTFSNTNINTTTNKVFRSLYSTISFARIQGLELISIREMKLVFKSYFHNITFKHYLEKPKPMIETILNKKKRNNSKLIEVLTETHRPRSYLIPLFFRFYPGEEQTNHQ